MINVNIREVRVIPDYIFKQQRKFICGCFNEDSYKKITFNELYDVLNDPLKYTENGNGCIFAGNRHNITTFILVTEL